MAVYQTVTTITGIFTYTDLHLNGKEILLAYDGNQTYRSTDRFDLTDSLILQWTGQGLSFQAWTITVQICAVLADGSLKNLPPWTQNGQVPSGGGSQLYQRIPVAVPGTAQ